jgi:hypothetical protein
MTVSADGQGVLSSGYTVAAPEAFGSAAIAQLLYQQLLPNPAGRRHDLC